MVFWHQSGTNRHFALAPLKKAGARKLQDFLSHESILRESGTGETPS